MNYSEALQNPIFETIGECADKMNIKTYVIGGFVRDFILKREGAKDIDIVAVGSGIELAQSVAQSLKGKPDVTVFKNFGSAMLKYNNLEIEFVGARKESYHRNSRKPIVEDGTLEDEQNRRDFTINALAISLNADSFGVFIDPFNGIDDLENKIIKTPLTPSITYSDDPLRMMRANRFATQLNFEIELSSLKAITENKERINIISKERIVDELHKIIDSTHPS